MIILTIVMIISIALFVYYKVAIVKNKDILTQKYFNGKSRVCLGTFVLFFAINQYIFYQTTLSLVIGLIFTLLASMQIYRGFNEARHYRNEWRRLNPTEH